MDFETTTIRVDLDTHARLLELSRASGRSLIDTVREATDMLRRIRFAQQVSSELQELRKNPRVWDAYIRDAGTTAVNDGIAERPA